MSCKTKEKQIKSREYITESGFSQETTENKEEPGLEETTELYKINEHPEDWRINDINTYELFIKALLFNYMEYTKGFYDKQLFITDSFRSSFNPEDYGISLSMDINKKDKEYFMIFDRDGKDGFEENTKETLKENLIIFYTLQDLDNRLKYKNKYVLKFEVDKENRLDNLYLLSKDVVENYEAEEDEYHKLFYDIISKVNIENVEDITEYKEYFDDICFNDSINNKIFSFIDTKEYFIELKIRKSSSNSNKIVFNAKLNHQDIPTYISFAYDYNIKNNKIYFCKLYSPKIVYLTEEEYNSPDIEIEDEYVPEK